MTDPVVPAIAFAVAAHRGQTRRGTDLPFVTHPIAVYTKLAQIGVYGKNELCAAVLHDVLEDTDVTYNELVQAFGPEVADLVTLVTFDKSATKADKVAALKTMDWAARVIKLADIYCNLVDFRKSLESPGADLVAVERFAAYALNAVVATVDVFDNETVKLRNDIREEVFHTLIQLNNLLTKGA